MNIAGNICVIYNPKAGKGRAKRRMDRLRATLGGRAEFQPTSNPGHGEDLAFHAAQNGFSVVAAAGGDGTVHEVANGILRAGRPEIALAVFPIGSANDYAHSLGQDCEWWLRPGAGESTRQVDVGIVRAVGGRERFFVNGLGLGFNGAITLESRKIRRLQGIALYSLAMLRALIYRFQHPRMSVTIDGQVREGPTLALTVAIGRREGNFIVAPGAIIDDGLFDFLHAGNLQRWEVARFVPALIFGRHPVHSAVWIGRCREIAVHSQSALTAHVDGEMFCQPEQGVEQLTIQILPGLLRVQY